MFKLKLRRKEVPWEVVDNKIVDPSPTHYEDDLEIAAVSPTDLRGTYVFDMKQKGVKGFKGTADLQRALVFSRQQLMREANKKGYNILLTESWQVVQFRKGKQVRVEVRYSGRPALCVGEEPTTRIPPFIGILHT